MAVITTSLVCDLQEVVKVTYLSGNLFSQDNQANVINVTVLDGGQPATISGTVTASIIRQDGGTVAATGGTITDNVVSITLPAAAYTVPGVVSIAVKLTTSGVITTLAAVVVTVYQSSTDTVVDPGTIIPSVQALISQIDAAVASIPADYSALWATIAPAFSTSATYSAGQYVTYNGGLYRFNTIHTGAWVAGDVTAVNIGGELTALKSALEAVDKTFSNEDHIVNFGYDTCIDVDPSGGTGASAIGVSQRRNLFVLNTTSSPSKAVRIKLNDGIIRTTDNEMVNSWSGISLKDGHMYRVSCIPVSGTSNLEVPNAISVYHTGTHSTIGYRQDINGAYTRLFKYTGTPVNIVWAIESGATYSNYTAYVVLKDITENVDYNLDEADTKFSLATKLVNYNYDVATMVNPDSSASHDSVRRLGVYRYKTSILLNGGNVSTNVYMRISDTIARTTSSTSVDDWTGITLKNGMRYRITARKVSGEMSGTEIIGISVYKTGEHSSIGRSARSGDIYYREFTCPNTNINIVMFIPSGVTFTNAKYVVILEELYVETNGRGAISYYTGESVNMMKRVSCEKYMTISTETSNGRQGATTYGDYLFVAYNKMPMISVYNFKTRSHVNNITFTPVDTYHCNNMNFGNEKYDADDAFPLLYVSQENIDEHKALVFRITESGGVFSATLVQTITYPDPATVSAYYGNCFIDTLNSLIFIEGYTQDSYSAGEKRTLRIMGYTLPALSDGDVTLNANDAIQNFTMTSIPTSVQGGFITGDKIIQAFGNPSNIPEIYLAQISLSSERFVTKVELNGIGITTEPEAVFVYEGHIYVFMQDRTIYKLYFD